jgi:hypothetical protein
MRRLDFHFKFAGTPPEGCHVHVAVDPDGAGAEPSHRVTMTRDGSTWTGGIDVVDLVKVPFVLSWTGGPAHTAWTLALVDSWPIPHIAARYDGRSSASSVGWQPGSVA